jgi:hypothetical protein
MPSQSKTSAVHEALRGSEQQFQLLVQAVKDYAIFMLDPQGRITTWNSGAERIKGYRAEEIIGEHFSRFYTQEDQREGVLLRLATRPSLTGLPPVAKTIGTVLVAALAASAEGVLPTITIFLYAFDLIELNGDGLRRDPLEVRKVTLRSMLAKASLGLRFNESLPLRA